MRRGIPEIIKEVLNEGSQKSKELHEKTRKRVLELGRSFSDQNYYYHLKKLVKGGEVKKIDIRHYELIEEVEIDAEVQECIKVIRGKEEQKRVIQDRIKQLRILSQNNRIATLSNVISTIEECLENPKILDYDISFEELTFMLKNILDFERKHRLSGSEKIIGILTGNILKKVIDRLHKKPDFPGTYTSRFLAASGERESVEVFFEKKIRALSKFDENQIETLGYNLKELYLKHQQIINSHIDDLLRSDDELYQKIAIKLRETILRG